MRTTYIYIYIIYIYLLVNIHVIFGIVSRELDWKSRLRRMCDKILDAWIFDVREVYDSNFTFYHDRKM